MQGIIDRALLEASKAASTALMLSLTVVCPTRAEVDTDPFLWLEDVEGDKALAWVEARNEESLSYLTAQPLFETLETRNLRIYDSAARIPTPGLRGEHVYNFWRDANNPRGLWRRVTLDGYVSGRPEWQTVIDVDALAAAEDEDWVWKGASCLRPAYRLCMVSLSRGGADATVIREFDVELRSFVDGGFVLEEAKSGISWIDRDTLFVGSDFGDGSLTDSGYPRTSRLWHRGEPPQEATEIFAGVATDVSAGAYRTWDGTTPYDFAYRLPSFFTRVVYLYEDETFVRVDLPDDARMLGILHGQMLVQLKSDWQVDGTTLAQGALVATDFRSFMRGERDFQVLIEPSPTTAIKRGGVRSTRDYLIVNLLDNVKSRLLRFSFQDGDWQAEDIDTDAIGNISLISAAEESNIFFFTYEDFLKPDTLFVANDGGRSIETIQSLPSFFKSNGMRAEQLFATSADGTRVPYFVVFPKGFTGDRKLPTLLHGYGGFEVSQVPVYSATVGHAWLERGGVYVKANIRGGGEFGPAWHQAALKENRQRAFDDFIAVAEDLVGRGITSPAQLGIRGGSNGGLLTGVMLTQRPDLFNAVVVQVPLLDMKRYTKLLAGASWMAEYGDPDSDDWDYIKRYSPYHNLDEGADYPKPFFTTSTRDDRVHPGHARKMVARMQAMGHELLYYENTVGGHAGASNNEQAARVQALIYTYLWDQLGGE